MAKLNTKIVMLEGEQGKDGTNIKSVENLFAHFILPLYHLLSVKDYIKP